MWEHQGADQCLLQEIIKVILFLKRQYYNVRVIFISQCKLCGTTKYRKGRHLNIRKCNMILWLACQMEVKYWPESLCSVHGQEEYEIMGTDGGVMIIKHGRFLFRKNYSIELQPAGRPAN